jgi:hypothetical protein
MGGAIRVNFEGQHSPPLFYTCTKKLLDIKVAPENAIDKRGTC